MFAKGTKLNASLISHIEISSLVRPAFCRAYFEKKMSKLFFRVWSSDIKMIFEYIEKYFFFLFQNQIITCLKQRLSGLNVLETKLKFYKDYLRHCCRRSNGKVNWINSSISKTYYFCYWFYSSFINSFLWHQYTSSCTIVKCTFN